MPVAGRAVDIKRPDYTGHFVGDHRDQSEINVKVAEHHGRPKYALFEADGLLLGCDDGSTRRVNSVALRYRFVNPTTFYGDSVSAGSSRTIYRIVKGKISRDGKELRGYVTQFEDAPTPTEPDCGSGARAQWRASLVRR
jgi:hypothetical protein